jgi:dihydropteroate synthase
MRQAYQWNLGRRVLELGRRTLVMGIVNVTPDSFSDGGHFLSPDSALERARQLLAEGADILDLGGESTHPGAAALGARQEQGRVLPVIAAVKREYPEAIVSIDTYKAETAVAAVETGVEIVNDVSGLMWDPAMPAALARLDCAAVLMHTRGTPGEWNSLPLEPDPVSFVLRGLTNSAGLAGRAGLASERLVLDPGFGFGKRFDENYPLLAHLEVFAQLGFPLLVGTSRKAFIGRTVAGRLAELGVWQPSPEVPILPTGERLSGTLATVVAAVLHGAHIVRVHDVRPAVEAVTIADAVLAVT